MRKWFYPLALVTLIGFLMLFLNLAHQAMVEFDKEATQALLGNEFLNMFHIFGEQSFIIIATLALMLFLAVYRKNYRGMLFTLFTVGGGNLLNQLLKKWVQRERPDFPGQVDGFSFPSGNAMVGLLYLFTFAYFLAERATTKLAKALIWIGAIALVILVGLSRISANAHYASDILAGWMAGYTLFVLVAVWYEWRSKQMDKRIPPIE